MSRENSWWVNLWAYLELRWDLVLEDAIDHVVIVVISVALATIIGVALGVATYRTQRPRDLVLAVTGTFLTIPSLALFGIFIAVPGLGLGGRSVVVALVMYGLLPIVRNTIVGLREVDSAVVESAQGMGLGRRQRLLRVELPLAWPVILTGIRVSTLILIGIAAIGAYINGPGLGEEIFAGLANLSSVTALSDVIAGTLGIVVLAILFDLFYVGVSRITIPKGIR
ncbi:MAG: ABC transporter permease [Nocardioidaceae bacterium]|nr:ABC transporter permease [Nocardioidaceae bacterium]